MKVVKIVKIETVNNTQSHLGEGVIGEWVAVDAAHVGETTHHLQMKIGERAIDAEGTQFDVEAWGETHFDCWNEALNEGFVVEG